MSEPPPARGRRSALPTTDAASPPRASLRPRLPDTGGRGSDSGSGTQAEAAAPASALVPDGRWRIDRDHSSVNFTVAYLGITRIRGRFMDLLGSFTASDGRLEGEASVAAGSIQTGSAVRDQHLQSADFLNAADHPRLVFALDEVAEGDEGRPIVHGRLSLNGVTQPVVFVVTPGGTAKDGYGHDRVGLQLDGAINRQDFGIRIDTDGMLVGEEIGIEIDLSLVREPDYLRHADIAA